MEKSCLIPSQATTFIGMTLDSLAMTTRLLPLYGQHGAPSCPIPRGLLTSIKAIVLLGLLLLHPLRWWLKAFYLDAKQLWWWKLLKSRRCFLALAPCGLCPHKYPLFRMGCSVAEQDVPLAVVKGRLARTHQCPGAVSCSHGSQEPPATSEKSARPRVVRLGRDTRSSMLGRTGS